MAIALVGSVGALSNVAAATVTPAFGQSTTAGNLLIGRVTADYLTSSTGSILTTGTGWVAVDTAATNSAIFYKKNCGTAETAPTFTCTSSSWMVADLMEVSGADTTSPLDQRGTQDFTSSGLTTDPVVTTAVDNSASNLAVMALATGGSKSATWTISDLWAAAGGTVIAGGDTGATKASHATRTSAYLLNGNGGSAADRNTVTATPSTGVWNAVSWSIASFLPAATAATSLIYDDRRIRRNILLRL